MLYNSLKIAPAFGLGQFFRNRTFVFPLVAIRDSRCYIPNRGRKDDKCMFCLKLYFVDRSHRSNTEERLV